MILRSGVSASPGNLLEMQTTGPHPRPTELETPRAVPKNLNLNKLFSSYLTVKSKNHWFGELLRVPDQFVMGLLSQGQQNPPSVMAKPRPCTARNFTAGFWVK